MAQKGATIFLENKTLWKIKSEKKTILPLFFPQIKFYNYLSFQKGHF